jgi:3-methylcrotonyl-CoA carboxylase alpha subunit
MLAGTEVAGSTVNTAFLAALAADPDFAAGDVDTGLIGRKQEELTSVPPPGADILAAAALAAAGVDGQARSDDPWSALAGYAHFHSVPKKVGLRFGDDILAAAVLVEDGSYEVALDGALPTPAEETAEPPADDQDADEPMLDIPFDGELLDRPLSDIRTVSVTRAGARPRLARWPGHVTVFDGAVGYTFGVPDPLTGADEAGAGADSLRAPMPGLVKVVRAAKDDRVAKGQPLLILEAMKMEHTIAAPHDGTIAEIAAEGAQVSDGTVLVRFAEGDA